MPTFVGLNNVFFLFFYNFMLSFVQCTPVLCTPVKTPTNSRNPLSMIYLIPTPLCKLHSITGGSQKVWLKAILKLCRCWWHLGGCCRWVTTAGRLRVGVTSSETLSHCSKPCLITEAEFCDQDLRESKTVCEDWYGWSWGWRIRRVEGGLREKV